MEMEKIMEALIFWLFVIFYTGIKKNFMKAFSKILYFTSLVILKMIVLRHNNGSYSLNNCR